MFSLSLKEQRLRYLKQQERRQQQTVSESEKLQRLKERVDSQEAKLKKIRAMRGQVDYSKVINGNLCMYKYNIMVTLLMRIRFLIFGKDNKIDPVNLLIKSSVTKPRDYE